MIGSFLGNLNSRIISNFTIRFQLLLFHPGRRQRRFPAPDPLHRLRRVAGVRGQLRGLRLEGGPRRRRHLRTQRGVRGDLLGLGRQGEGSTGTSV